MNRLVILIYTAFVYSCASVEPKNVKVEDRLRPAYNYVLMQKIDGNKSDYHWGEDYQDGYYRTGYKFNKVYTEVMSETNDMSNENAYKVYKQQKSKIARRYKTQGDKFQAQKEQGAIEEFDPKKTQENEEIIVTNDNDFSVTKDIVINVDQKAEKEKL